MLRKIESSGNMTLAEFAERNTHDTSLFMGMENYLLKTTPEVIASRRQSVTEAVLKEQQRQVDEGICDVERMARVSRGASDVSRERAQIVALLHADKRRGG